MVFHCSRAGAGCSTLNSSAVQCRAIHRLKVEHHLFPKLRLVSRPWGPATGILERFMMSEKLPLMLTKGAAGKLAGMVVPELAKRGVNVLMRDVGSAIGIVRGSLFEQSRAPTRAPTVTVCLRKARLCGGPSQLHALFPPAATTSRGFPWTRTSQP
jgi:hypothetical protein